MKKKIVRIDVDKCNGCRACEAICSAFHATPRYGSSNPDRSRIRVVHDPRRDIFVPVYAGEYTDAECIGKNVYTVDGKTYDECDFCRASCPSRTLFRDPDSGLPLKCDMCEDEPPLKEPKCVEWCLNDALIYEEVEVPDVPGKVEPKAEEMEVGLESLVKKHGMKTVMDSLAKLGKA